ncbi:hypothetical protein EYR40_007292 [Pleurotus pulmonarius]|nr:hypothetical protein EYR36_003427 [Pleurotus pulmonarius]KAF4577540.1 hypothetical protein EYR36_005530 [Pleurotus pulmonarius]KAF4580681.1 hypothetical protein EYR40_003080 [Pleurotus pulmonarius]KAF4600181.1 hypothetical protein EYR40_007292 [Pleurotus pulmonarius]
MVHLPLATPPLGCNIAIPLTADTQDRVMQFLATLRQDIDHDPAMITWSFPDNEANKRYLVPTNVPDLSIAEAPPPDMSSATNIVCGACGALNYTKDKKQYYAVTAGTRVGVVKGADVARALIDGVSGGVCVGYRSEAEAVEQFQAGVKVGSVRIIPAPPRA